MYILHIVQFTSPSLLVGSSHTLGRYHFLFSLLPIPSQYPGSHMYPPRKAALSDHLAGETMLPSVMLAMYQALVCISVSGNEATAAPSIVWQSQPLSTCRRCVHQKGQSARTCAIRHIPERDPELWPSCVLRNFGGRLLLQCQCHGDLVPPPPPRTKSLVKLSVTVI